MQSMVDPTQTVSMCIWPGLLWISPSAASAICLAIGRSNGSRIASVVTKRRLTLWRSCTRFAHGPAWMNSAGPRWWREPAKEASFGCLRSSGMMIDLSKKEYGNRADTDPALQAHAGTNPAPSRYRAGTEPAPSGTEQGTAT